MAVRVLLLLLSLTILANIIILAVSVIFNVNLYKKHGKAILNGFGLFVLAIVITYTVLAVLGLI